MLRLFLVCSILYQCVCDPRSPRVYNVLITSKKNLAPSQALPVYQPVLRTTSVGLAFTPFLFTHLTPLEPPTSYLHSGPVVGDILNLPKELQPDDDDIETTRNREHHYTGRNLPSNVVSLQHYEPVYNPPQITYRQFIPLESGGSIQRPQSNRAEQPQLTNVDRSRPTLQPVHPVNGEPVDPKQIIANLKRNPEIPDVPPPALPVRTS